MPGHWVKQLNSLTWLTLEWKIFLTRGKKMNLVKIWKSFLGYLITQELQYSLLPIDVLGYSHSVIPVFIYSITSY